MNLEQIASTLSSLKTSSSNYAQQAVEQLLSAGIELSASDIHLQPTQEGHLLSYRIDGVLHQCGAITKGETSNIIARLKVLAGLLTYRTDIPQEGRIREDQATHEMRISTFPALYGERLVVRIFKQANQFLGLSDLGLETEVASSLCNLLNETSGLILVTGPAGSGKSTTAYACLRHLAQTTQGSRSIVSLEDPIEVVIPGVSQSQVNESGEFDFPTGLKSLMRQDPEVIFIGEIRDNTTAEVALQASLTGQLVISTFHAGSAAESLTRLIDMGIPEYIVINCLKGILHQRLVRKLCSCCNSSKKENCDQCNNTGYLGRTLITEWLVPSIHGLNSQNIRNSDANSLEIIAKSAGMTTRWEHAVDLVQSTTTDQLEINRVLGFRQS